MFLLQLLWCMKIHLVQWHIASFAEMILCHLQRISCVECLLCGIHPRNTHQTTLCVVIRSTSYHPHFHFPLWVHLNLPFTRRNICSYLSWGPDVIINNIHFTFKSVSDYMINCVDPCIKYICNKSRDIVTGK